MQRKKVVAQLPAHVRPGNVANRYEPELEALAPIADIVEVSGSDAEAFAAGARDADAIITSWGIRFDQAIIGKLEKCVVIGVGSVGVDMVDIAAATEAGIVVTNVPDVFIEEVADHAMMLLLAAGRRIRTMEAVIASGNWHKGRAILNAVPRLMGQTLGLFAFGNIARCTARRAAAFGLRVIAHDPYVSELTMSEAGVEPVGFTELLERSDYLSVHAPLNDETYHTFNAAAFAQMKPTAVLINSARGPIVEESALIDALAGGRLAAAGLDVFETEPVRADSPLLQMDNVVVTPHVASATSRMRPETRRRVGREVALVLRNRWPRSCVNPTVLPKLALERWQPYPMNRGPNR